MGLDLNNDNTIDSFFVNFNYLARNTVINGNAAGMIAISPKTPDFSITQSGNDLTVQIIDQQQYLKYRICIRTLTHDWDSVYTFSGSTTHTLYLQNDNYKISVASVDGRDVESLFSKEIMTNVTNVEDVAEASSAFELLQNRPNPFDEATMIGIVVNKPTNHKFAYLSIVDIATGKEVKKMPLELKKGLNEIIYAHGYHASGSFIYTLVIDGKPLATKKMVVAN